MGNVKEFVMKYNERHAKYRSLWIVGFQGSESVTGLSQRSLKLSINALLGSSGS